MAALYFELATLGACPFKHALQAKVATISECGRWLSELYLMSALENIMKMPDVLFRR